jgi:hypothetical protein
MARGNVRSRKGGVFLGSLLLLSSLGNGQERASSPGDGKASLLSWVDLESIATALRNAGHREQQSPYPSNQQAHSDQKQEYIELYSALTKLQSTRATYMQSLQFYLDSVKSGMPKHTVNVRQSAFHDQVDLLKTDLQALSNALAPLQISLDLSEPDLSRLISSYLESRQAKLAEVYSPGLLETLTVPELTQFQEQAKKNSKVLENAITEFQKVIRARYPELSH